MLGFAVTGITNKSLRAWMTRLLGVPYAMTRASYDLTLLSRQRADRPHPAPQHLPAHPRRATVRRLLHQGPRPGALPADGRPPHHHADRGPRCARHHRPTYHQPRSRRQPPARGLNPRQASTRDTGTLVTKTQDKCRSPRTRGSLDRLGIGEMRKGRIPTRDAAEKRAIRPGSHLLTPGVGSDSANPILRHP